MFWYTNLNSVFLYRIGIFYVEKQVFMGIEEIVKCFVLMSLSISAIWALIVYKKQQKIARIQNLVSVFRRFAENSQFVELFALCDALYSCGDSGARAADIEKLKTFDSGGKYRYLALLEEVAVYAKNDAVLQSDALHLFQYHFHYIYNCPDIVAAFWWNIGGEASGREHTKKGWRYQSDFALQCRASIGR